MQMYICMRACISTPNSATLTRTTSAAFRSEETRDREITLDPFPGLDIYIYIYICLYSKFLWKIFVWNSWKKFSSFLLSIVLFCRGTSSKNRGRKERKKVEASKKSAQVIGKSKSRRFSRASYNFFLFFSFSFSFGYDSKKELRRGSIGR